MQHNLSTIIPHRGQDGILAAKTQPTNQNPNLSIPNYPSELSLSLTGGKNARRGTALRAEHARVGDLSGTAVVCCESRGVRRGAFGPAARPALQNAAYVQGRGLYALDSAVASLCDCAMGCWGHPAKVKCDMSERLVHILKTRRDPLVIAENERQQS